MDACISQKDNIPIIVSKVVLKEAERANRIYSFIHKRYSKQMHSLDVL